MYQCKDVAKEANDYIDGNISLRKRFGLFLHLIVCSCCRNYLQQIRSTISTITILKPKEKSTTNTKDLAKKLRDISCNND